MGRSAVVAAVVASAALGTSNVAPAALDTCNVQREPPHRPGPSAQHLQGDMPHEIGAQLERAFGGQYGDVWYDTEGRLLTFRAGLAPGPLTLKAARRIVEGLLRREVRRREVAFVQRSVFVVRVPYAFYPVLLAQEAIRQRLHAFLPWTLFSAGAGPPQRAGITGFGYWPQVQVRLARLATDGECASALAIVESYGHEASLRRIDRELGGVVAQERG
jgi:hypothetical protein